MLVLNPQNRITIQDAKEHPYFNNIDTDYSELAKITSYIIDKKIKQLVKWSSILLDKYYSYKYY